MIWYVLVNDEPVGTITTDLKPEIASYELMFEELGFYVETRPGFKLELKSAKQLEYEHKLREFELRQLAGRKDKK